MKNNTRLAVQNALIELARTENQDGNSSIVTLALVLSCVIGEDLHAQGMDALAAFVVPRWTHTTTDVSKGWPPKSLPEKHTGAHLALLLIARGARAGTDRDVADLVSLAATSLVEGLAAEAADVLVGFLARKRPLNGALQVALAESKGLDIDRN